MKRMRRRKRREDRGTARRAADGTPAAQRGGTATTAAPPRPDTAHGGRRPDGSLPEGERAHCGRRGIRQGRQTAGWMDRQTQRRRAGTE